MKILQVATVRSDRASGVSIYVLELIKALLASGGCAIGLLPALAGVDPLEQSRIPGCVALPPPRRRHFNPWSIGPSWLERIEAAFGRPDIVNFHGVYDPFQTALGARMRERGWSYVVTTHAGLQKAAQKRSALKKALGNLLFFDSFIRGAAAVHASSPSEAEAVQTRYPGVKTFFVANAVPSDSLAELTSRPPPAAPAPLTGPLHVGFVGRLEVHHKGLDLLMQAIKLLESRCPELDMRFSFVGAFHTPEDEARMTTMRSALERPERVRFAGPLSGKEKWAALGAFDVFIHTSRYEGMPAAILEAMAFKKPCILTPGTNLQHVLTRDEGGWACGENAESIAQALRDAAASRSELTRRGENARRHVMAHHTWAMLAKDYVRELSRLIR